MLKTAAKSLLVTSLLLGCGQQPDETPPLSAADLESLAGLRLALIDAIEAGDATAYAALCTEDVQLLHADSPLITGRQELETHNAAIFEAVTVANLDLTPVDVYGVGDLAYEVGTQDLSIEPAVPQFRGSRKYVHILRHGEDGEWRFAVLISNNS